MGKHTIPTLDYNWYEFKHEIASSLGSGSDKTLSVRVGVDGNGNMFSICIVTSHETTVEYDTLDAAINAYNSFP